MKALIIPFDSFVGITTNSSSELFIIPTKEVNYKLQYLVNKIVVDSGGDLNHFDEITLAKGSEAIALILEKCGNAISPEELAKILDLFVSEETKKEKYSEWPTWPEWLSAKWPSWEHYWLGVKDIVNDFIDLHKSSLDEDIGTIAIVENTREYYIGPDIAKKLVEKLGAIQIDKG